MGGTKPRVTAMTGAEGSSTFSRVPSYPSQSSALVRTPSLRGGRKSENGHAPLTRLGSSRISSGMKAGFSLSPLLVSTLLIIGSIMAFMMWSHNITVLEGRVLDEIHSHEMRSVMGDSLDEGSRGYVKSITYAVTKAPFDSYLFEDSKTHYGRKLGEFVWAGENICYDPKMRSFLFSVDPQSGIDSFLKPEILSRTAVVRPLHLSEVKTWVEGFTAITTGFALNQTGAHFYFWGLPAFHISEFARRHLHEPRVSVAFDRAYVPPSHELEKEIFDVLFSRTDELVSLEHLTGITCFRKGVYAQRTAPADIKMTAFAQDVRVLKDDYGKLHGKSMVLDCADPRANHKTIWLAQRRVYSRKMINLEDVKRSVARVFGPEWNVMVFDSANTPCSRSYLGTGCVGLYDCKSPGFVDKCVHSKKSLKWDVDLFQNMTFVVSVHGATFMNLPWIPERSHVVEMFPYGVTERCYQMYSQRSNLMYFKYDEANSTAYDAKFKHIPPADCFGVNECRWEVKKMSFYVTVEALEKVLIRARDSYLRTCMPK